MDAKNSENKWITRKGAKKLINRSFSVSNNNEKNKKMSRNKSVNIMPSWERKQNHTITSFIKKSSSPKKVVDNISKSQVNRSENFHNQRDPNSINEQLNCSEETKVIFKAKEELVSNEKCIKDQLKISGKETKMIIKPKREQVSKSSFCNFTNSSNHESIFDKEEYDILQSDNSVLNEKNKDGQLINLKKVDISSDHKICNLSSPLNISHHFKSDVKYIHKKSFDLDEIFQVPKFPHKAESLKERLACIVNGEVTDLALNTKDIKDCKVISLKYGYKQKIKGELNNIFKCQNFKNRRLLIRERLSQFM